MNRAGGGALAALALAVPVAIVLGIVLAASSSESSSASGCTPASAGPVDAAAIPADAKVGAFGREQLGNAAAIINAAATLTMPEAAQALGVQAAVGESSLNNIGYGDNAINPDGSVADSIGLFQQQSSWGTTEQRMDPTTSASLFFQRLTAVPDWEGLDSSIAINKVQINADPFHYSRYRADAVAITDYLAKLGGTPGGGTSGCSISGDAQEVAQGLVTAMDNGSLKFLEPRYQEQVKNVANGSASADCQLDLRVLQVITLALNKFESVGVGSLNRKCTGSLIGAGTASAHYRDGGGRALDFYQIDGVALTGNTSQDLAVIDLFSSVAPEGSRIGQVQCRSGQTWPNLTQFRDSCDHAHMDFGFSKEPLRVAG